MKLPWGKYKGQDIEDVPTSYLYWLAENVTNPGSLVREAEEQIALREGKGRVVRQPR